MEDGGKRVLGEGEGRRGEVARFAETLDDDKYFVQYRVLSRELLIKSREGEGGRKEEGWNVIFGNYYSF